MGEEEVEWKERGKAGGGGAQAVANGPESG